MGIKIPHILLLTCAASLHWVCSSNNEYPTTLLAAASLSHQDHSDTPVHLKFQPSKYTDNLNVSITTLNQHVIKYDVNTDTTNPLNIGSTSTTQAFLLKLSTWITNYCEENEESLAQLMNAIVTKELEKCVLVVAADQTFWSSHLMELLSRLPNLKQIVKVMGEEELAEVFLEVQQCRGYVFLLSDAAPLFTMTQTLSGPWDYDGRYVVVGISQQQMEALTLTKKGRKTQHLVGVFQSTVAGEYEVFVNTLYQEEKLTRVFTWHDKRSSSASLSIFPDKITDLHGATLNVVTFEFPPNVMYLRSREGAVILRYGIDIDMVTSLARIFNFTINILESPPGEMWGDITANGTWNGMVGLFGREEGDIGVANIFITAVGGRQEFQEYTTYYDQESTCFMIQSEGEFPRWQSLALPFTRTTWLAVLVVLIVTGPLLYFLAKLTGFSGEKMAAQSLSYTTLYTAGMHFRYSLRVAPSSASLQVFLLFLWFYITIITTGYCSNLTAFLTVDRSPPGINSIKELYHSSLSVFGLGSFFGYSMAESTNEDLRGLSKRFISMRSFEDISHEVLMGKGVMIQTRRYHQFSMTRLTTSLGIPMVRIMTECFLPFNVAIALQSHSPLKKSFDRVVGLISQAGLVNFWFKQALVLSQTGLTQE
ncbi:ionotropic receptor 93a-like [Cherax quadricarinatus]|uniref:ionotropic receptor 93a-like n=1 Tax=Cherax quadricarinatus TaxID=27406 RepID=UPI00387E711F